MITMDYQTHKQADKPSKPVRTMLSGSFTSAGPAGSRSTVVGPLETWDATLIVLVFCNFNKAERGTQAHLSHGNQKGKAKPEPHFPREKAL